MALVHQSRVGRGGGSLAQEIHAVTLAAGTAAITTGLKHVYSVQLTYNEGSAGATALSYTKSGGTVTVFGDGTDDVDAVILGY